MMSETSITRIFSTLTDPRKKRLPVHPLINILTITICAVISGCDDFNSIAVYGKSKQDFFSKFLDLSEGIPSHDTFNDVLNRLDPNEFQHAFRSWIKELSTRIEDVIAIDGKTLRGTKTQGEAFSALHLVNAWSCANHLCLGQIKVDSKSNEITAIPKLLEILDIKNATITIDAMGCQHAIAEQITASDANYIFALKGNQGELHEDVKLFLDKKFNACNFQETHCDINGDHGRIEQRTILIDNNVAWLKQRHPAWKSIESIALVESIREIKEQKTTERRYFVSSHKDITPDEMLNKIRAHWSVENNLHWQLDISFNEDYLRLRSGYAAENISAINKLSLALLKNETSIKAGIKTKRLKAGWDNEYLLKVLKVELVAG